LSIYQKIPETLDQWIFGSEDLECPTVAGCMEGERHRWSGSDLCHTPRYCMPWHRWPMGIPTQSVLPLPRPIGFSELGRNVSAVSGCWAEAETIPSSLQSTMVDLEQFELILTSHGRQLICDNKVITDGWYVGFCSQGRCSYNNLAFNIPDFKFYIGSFLCGRLASGGWP